MIRCDYHLHTNHSSDGKSPMEEYIIKAIAENVDELCFTEHYDFNDSLPDNYGATTNLDKYVDEFKIMKEKYKGSISLKLGIEVGLRSDIEDTIIELVKKYDWDFVLGSSHVVDQFDIGYNPTGYFDDITLEEGYRRYLEEIYKNVLIFFDEFDVYGHLDYVVRYGNTEDKHMEYNDYSELIDRILLELIRNGKGIEVNTSGYRYGLESTHPNYDVLRRYKELGGTIITLGSDAHHLDNLCYRFDEVMIKLKEIGFEHITIFEKRKPISIEF